MQNYQIFALVLGVAVLVSWLSKNKSINQKSRLVDEDKFERKRLLDTYYTVYGSLVVILCCLIWNSYNIGKFIFDTFEFNFTPQNISISIFIFGIILAFLARKFIDKENTNNKNIVAKPQSTFKLSPKKLNIGVLEGHFLNSKLTTFLNFEIRVDDYTIQKVKFDKEGILLKKEYISKIFKLNRFDEDDFKIIEKIEMEINSINEFEFKLYKSFEKRIQQLIIAILSKKKYTFSFGQIKQYSNTVMVDEILIFLQEIQENRFSDSSLPYLLHFKEVVN